MKMLSPFLLFVMVLAAGPACAEIVKSSVPCEGNNCLYWWPKTASPEGWHQDRKASDARGINAQAPKDENFADASTIMYAKAIYKPLVPTLSSLDVLIEADKKDFLSRDEEMTIKEIGQIKTGDGLPLTLISFSPSKTGNWEQAAYGEQDKFFLIFSVSSKTSEDLKKSLDAFRRFVTNYSQEEIKE